MTEPKAASRRLSSRFPVATQRPGSGVRVRSAIQLDPGDGASAPATLPPPPFLSEASVAALEWWLGAHMALASELAWLEQVVEAGPAHDRHLSTLALLAGQAGGVRDALYELYCDAADERLSGLGPAGVVLERHVRASYVWCGRVVSLLARVASELRQGASVDWASLKTGFRQGQDRYVPRSEAVRLAIHGLGIDTTNPVEPLRNLPLDLETLFRASEDLQGALASRFG